MDTRYVTEEEFLSWPSTPERVELLDGEVIVSPSVTWRHQHVSGRLYLALEGWAAGEVEPYTVGYAPCDFRFGPARILQPDLYVVRGRLPLDTPMPLRVVPALCVEILSPSNVDYDRRTRRLVYAEANVPEATFASPTLPDLTVDVRALVG